MKSNGTFKLLMILSGDVELNPSPALTCSSCLKQIRRNQLKGTCQNCKQCFHIKCLKENVNDTMFCNTCYIRPTEPIEETRHDDRQSDCYDNLRSYIAKTGLKILHQNVNGLLSKIDMIREMFDSLNNNIHVLGVTESKLNSTILDAEVRINGYVGIRHDRTSIGGGGGVIAFVHDDINFQRRTDLENQSTEAVWLELFVKYSKSILVCFTYRPPNSSEHLNKNFNEVFNEMVMTALQENKEIILLGDLNCDYSKPTDNSCLKDIIKINGLKQMITQPTRTTMTTSSLIDIVLNNTCQEHSLIFFL